MGEYARLWSTQASELLPLAQPVCDRKSGKPGDSVPARWNRASFYPEQREPRANTHFSAGFRLDPPGGCLSTNSPGRNLAGTGETGATAPRPPATAPTRLPTWSRRGLRTNEVRAVKYCSSSESESSWLQ